VPRGELEYPEWVAVGHRLGAVGRSSQWWVGDWLRYGTARWGEKYVEAARITGYDGGSLRNLAWMASQFDLSRRRDNLTWSHHAAVAGLDREEQEAWLDRAGVDRLSVNDLRIEVRSSLRQRERTGASGDQGEGGLRPGEGGSSDLPSGDSSESGHRGSVGVCAGTSADSLVPGGAVAAASDAAGIQICPSCGQKLPDS
jgi:hypothetical protein